MEEVNQPNPPEVVTVIVTTSIKSELEESVSTGGIQQQNHGILVKNNIALPVSPGTAPISHVGIGSKNSAFKPFKAITVLTNLQRGNFKTLHKDVTTPLNFHEKAARGDLKAEDVDESNLDSEDQEGKTALIWAAYHARFATVKMLIEKGANVNYQGLSEETPLMYAASNGRTQTHIEIINALIEAGADVDATDYEGNTPLIYATSGNHGGAVAALLQHGACFDAVNENGDSAFNIAVTKGHLAAMNALENHLREVIEKNFIK